jgi:hypothetical protein
MQLAGRQRLRARLPRHRSQKAGTTWLWENLRRHPEIFVPEKKELHYFDNKFEQLPASRAASKRAARSAEITPAYGISPRERIRFIRAIMPRVRLILLIRNPVERAWSQAVMDLVVRSGRRWARCRRRSSSPFSNRALREPGLYCRMLDNWPRLLPVGAALRRFFEDIRERPGSPEQLFAHLGVSSEVDWEGSRSGA